MRASSVLRAPLRPQRAARAAEAARRASTSLWPNRQAASTAWRASTATAEKRNASSARLADGPHRRDRPRAPRAAWEALRVDRDILKGASTVRWGGRVPTRLRAAVRFARLASIKRRPAKRRAPCVSGESECAPTPSGFVRLLTPSLSVRYSAAAETSTACTDCIAGQYVPASAAGATACIVCAAGRWSETSAATICPRCAAGRFSPGPGHDQACTDCEAGKASADTAADSCDDCPAGKYQAAEGRTSCISCDEGTFQDSSAQEACSNCTTCSAPQYLSASCAEGSTQDSTCAPCSSCGDAQYQRQPCSETEDTQCRDCTQCKRTQPPFALAPQCTSL